MASVPVVDDPEIWRWVWLVAIGVFGVGEALIAGAFFLLPFAIGATFATIAAFAGASVAVQWALFVGVSAISAASLIPLRRRLDRTEVPSGVGSRRLIGQEATVLQAIAAGPGETGEVRVGRENWRAESAEHAAIATGATVVVTDVRGTAVVVRPTTN